MTYEVLRYEPRFRDAVLDLQVLLWGPELELNDRYFEWKYETNPWQRTPKLYLVLQDGTLIGMRGFFGSRWEAGSPTDTFDIPCAGDLVIKPEHRDRGVITQLMRRVVEDESNAPSPFFFNLSAGAPTRLAGLSLGWRDIGPVRQLRWERPKGLLDRVMKDKSKANVTGKGPFHEIDDHLQRGTKLSASIELSATPRPPEMSALVRQRGHDGRIRHVRDEAFFGWRFRHPRADFRFFFHQSGTAIDAYLVLQARRTGDNDQVKIVDSAGDAKALVPLLDLALTEFGLRRVACWRASLADIPEAELVRCGFTDVPVRSMAESFPTVMMLPNQTAPSEMSWQLAGRDVREPGNWDLRQAYGDGS